VDYIVTEYNHSLILGHDFAVSGDTVQGVGSQVTTQFLPYAAQKPSWAPWTEKNSVFCNSSLYSKSNLVTWVGINDVARWLDINAQLTLLFQLQDLLYNVGARKFVFLTVPPVDRSPWGTLLVGGS
jgi:hypothetical protein